MLFSNAGNRSLIRPLAEFPEEVFDSVIAVHVRGAVFLLIVYLLPRGVLGLFQPRRQSR